MHWSNAMWALRDATFGGVQRSHFDPALIYWVLRRFERLYRVGITSVLHRCHAGDFAL